MNANPAASSVFLTRDAVHFRTVRSPVAQLATRFFAALAGDSAVSASLRKCFAHAVLDHALPAASQYSPALDDQIRAYMQSPPQLVLIQGPFKVDFVLEDPPTPGTPKSVSTISSSLTAHNGPTNLIDVIFAGFTLHNELLRCQREDKEQFARYSLFALATIAHETSHWLYTKVSGYRSDPLRAAIRPQGMANGNMAALPSASVANHGQKVEDPLVALGTRPDDCGARTVDMLLGHTCQLVSFADGDTEVIKRKIQPAITAESPVLSGKALEEILGTSLPKITDISGHAPVVVGGQAPKWSDHDTYLVTSQTSTNSFCSHGICRIGQLF